MNKSRPKENTNISQWTITRIDCARVHLLWWRSRLCINVVVESMITYATHISWIWQPQTLMPKTVVATKGHHTTNTWVDSVANKFLWLWWSFAQLRSFVQSPSVLLMSFTYWAQWRRKYEEWTEFNCQKVRSVPLFGSPHESFPLTDQRKLKWI